MSPRIPSLSEKSIQKIILIPHSYKKLTGKELVSGKKNIIESLWSSPLAILAHDNQPDPIFFYGNAKALELFEMDFSSFTKLPSRLSAEPCSQSERAKLLERVHSFGFIEDYEGIRISSTGKRFRIRKASVWNLTDENGNICGQAAAITSWCSVK